MSIMNLDPFTKAFLQCALWTIYEQPLDATFTTDDFESETLEQLVADCQKFQEENPDIKDNEQAGIDFFVSRSMSSIEFLTPGWWHPEHAERLSSSSFAFPKIHLYFHQGKVCACPAYQELEIFFPTPTPEARAKSRKQLWHLWREEVPYPVCDNQFADWLVERFPWICE